MIKQYVVLMRVQHYVKNLLIFAALFCSGQILVPAKISADLLGFFSFCATSSAIYIINDIHDREKDRCHPRKCKRPIASGAVSVKQASTLAGILFVAATLCILPVFELSAFLLLALYVVLNLAYSCCGLKNVPILDISILAAGFVIRVIFGAQLADIIISNWLYLAVFALSFYMALGKRRGELIRGGSSNTRSVLDAYPLEFLNRSMTMCLALGNVFYALWSMDQVTASFYNNRLLIFTVPIVLVITLKYSLTIENTTDGDPVEVLLHDRVLIFLVMLYLLAMSLIIYI